MKGSYLAVPLTICTYVFLEFISLDIATGFEDEAYCFRFTWPGVGKDNESAISCSKLNKRKVPCIKDALYFNDTKPDTTEIWKHYRQNYTQRMESSNVCIRYTYIYNGAVVNVSYFPGKVTEDQTTPVTSGCYVQYTEGYNIEVCACKSENNSMPCNSTIRNTYSTPITFAAVAVLLFIYKIFDIP